MFPLLNFPFPHNFFFISKKNFYFVIESPATRLQSQLNVQIFISGQLRLPFMCETFLQHSLCVLGKALLQNTASFNFVEVTFHDDLRWNIHMLSVFCNRPLWACFFSACVTEKLIFVKMFQEYNRPLTLCFCSEFH